MPTPSKRLYVGPPRDYANLPEARKREWCKGFALALVAMRDGVTVAEVVAREAASDADEAAT
jgi:hypothetical protein